MLARTARFAFGSAARRVNMPATAVRYMATIKYTESHEFCKVSDEDSHLIH